MFKSRILDTLIFKNSQIHLLKYHIERTFEAYQFLGIHINQEEIAQLYGEIQNKYSAQVKTDECLRLFFSDSKPATYTAEVKKILVLNNPINLKLHILEKPQKDLFQFKWENRKYWEDLIQQFGQNTDDLLLINPDQQLVETTRFNIFTYSTDTNTVYTPPLSSGCLNGTYRRYVLDQKQIVLPDKGKVQIIEKNILANEIDGFELYVANAVRGVLKAELLRNF